MTQTIYTACNECGVFIGPDRGHGVLCSKASAHEISAHALKYYSAWLESQKSLQETCKRMAQEATLWQGKYLIVVRENNALRKKLNKIKP